MTDFVAQFLFLKVCLVCVRVCVFASGSFCVLFTSIMSRRWKFSSRPWATNKREWDKAKCVSNNVVGDDPEDESRCELLSVQC